MSQNLAYKISHDVSHFSQPGQRDAYLVNLPGHKKYLGWSRLGFDIKEIPEEVYFQTGISNLLPDFLQNDVGWPIMSKKMIAVLQQVGDFKCHLIPLLVIDNSVPEEQQLTDEGKFKPGVLNHDYVALYLLEHADAFDWDNSEYKIRSYTAEGEAGSVRKTVLKEPDGGYPPIFRLSASPGKLYVSQGARHALENAKITGISYSLPE